MAPSWIGEESGAPLAEDGDFLDMLSDYDIVLTMPP